MKTTDKIYTLTITKKIEDRKDPYIDRSYPQEEHITTVSLTQDQVMRMIATGLDIKNKEGYENNR